MDIKHMKYFVEVVKQGMTNASKSLYIAQPTISKAIGILKQRWLSLYLTGVKEV